MLKVESLLLLALIPMTTWGAPGLCIKGTRINGLSFSGRLAGVERSLLLLVDDSMQTSPQMGIELSGIRQIGINGSVDDDQVLPLLGQWLMLLPLWDEATLSRLISAIADTTRHHDWETVFTWTSRLLDSRGGLARITELKLYRAWALFELRLLNEARKAVRDLAKDTDPMQASPRLC